MKKRVVGFGMASLLIIPAVLCAESQVEWSPLSIAALQEFGILKSGHYATHPDPFKDEWVDHFGAFVTQTTKVNDRLTFDIGLGGIFQFQSPQVINPEWGGSQYKSFFIGPTIADLRYVLGNVEKPVAMIQVGAFPFKYSASSNLGEYLFRSGPYPTFLWTGGYSMVNSASANVQGLRVNVSVLENLSLDFFLTTETNLPPLYDFTLTGLAKYSIAHGLIEVGGGVQFKRLIQVDADKTTKKSPYNAYFVRDGVTYVGNINYYANQKDFWNKRKTLALNAKDSAAAAAYEKERAGFETQENNVRTWTSPEAATQPSYSYYTTAGTTLMGRIEIDPKKIISSDMFGENDLKLYGEAAVLGWKNYPIFYENRADRMPGMIGFNIPGFKILDLISLEYEVFTSPWMNSFSELAGNAATPQIASGKDTWNSDEYYNDIASKDNHSWSLLIQKKIAHSLTLSGQVARDHARMVSLDSWFGPGVDPNEVLSTSKDWYWMLQFSFGI